MRKHNRQNHFIAIANDGSPSTNLSDTAGNPSESYDWGHMAVVRQEWLHQFGQPYVNAFEPTVREITNTEMQVRKELYP
jgi:hypothetical protein